MISLYYLCKLCRWNYHMTECVFISDRNGDITEFEIFGHTGLDIEGKDVLCAAVSALVSHTIGAIHEFTHVACANVVDEKKPSVTFTLTDGAEDDRAQLFLRALISSLEDLEYKYPDGIKVNY